jgi:nicotinamide mononucleotide adenylyltransferase
VNYARQAEELANNELLQVIFNDVRNLVIQQWELSDNAADREILHSRLKAIEMVRNQVNEYIERWRRDTRES